nr:DUF3147 family protein [Melghirimyces profundicolus]
MLFILIKALVSATVILFVTWLANRSPTFGGWIAALPLVSLLSAFWLSLGKQSSREIADFLTGVLWGLIPTALLLLVIVLFLRYHVSFLLSLFIGISIWGVITYLVQAPQN